MYYKLPITVTAITMLCACLPVDVDVSSNAELQSRYIKMDDAGDMLADQTQAYNSRRNSTWECVYDTQTQLVWEVKTTAIDGQYNSGGHTYSWYEKYSNPGWQVFNQDKYSKLNPEYKTIFEDESRTYDCAALEESLKQQQENDSTIDTDVRNYSFAGNTTLKDDEGNEILDDEGNRQEVSKYPGIRYEYACYKQAVDANWDKYDPQLEPGNYYGKPDGGVCSFTDCDTKSYAAYKNATNDCGANMQWRLPTQNELRGLLVCTSDPDTCLSENTLYIATAFFPNTYRGNYWAFANEPLLDKAAPLVNFMTGESRNAPKSNDNAVRMVFGPVEKCELFPELPECP